MRCSLVALLPVGQLKRDGQGVPCVYRLAVFAAGSERGQALDHVQGLMVALRGEAALDSHISNRAVAFDYKFHDDFALNALHDGRLGVLQS